MIDNVNLKAEIINLIDVAVAMQVGNNAELPSVTKIHTRQIVVESPFTNSLKDEINEIYPLVNASSY